MNETVAAPAIIPVFTDGAADPHPHRRTEILVTTMSFVDTGTGEPVVFLHAGSQSGAGWASIWTWNCKP